MGHDHAGHSHGVDATSNPRWLWIALGLNFAFMLVEVAVGLIANSVALLSDAAHMLTDTASIGLALGAISLAARPPSGSFTFGLKRSEILSAQLNGASLLVLATFLAFEAVGRLSDPPAVEGGLVIVVGVVGALVNLAAALSLARANRTNLNVEGAYLHNLADLWSSVAAIGAGVLIVTTGFDQADGIAALTVCALMLWGGFGLIRDSGRILLEGAPKGMEPGRDRTRAGLPARASWRSTTCTCGRSRRASRRCRPTCWWPRATTATRAGASSSACSRSASASSTPRSRWTTSASAS